MANCIEDRQEWKYVVGPMVKAGCLIQAHRHYLNMVHFIKRQRYGAYSVSGDDLKRYARLLLEVPEHFKSTFALNPAVLSKGFDSVLSAAELRRCEEMLKE